MKDKRVDLYIAKAQPFARPILNHFRTLIHKACPEVQETIKWGFTAFDYKGPFCTMAAFKHYVVFGFWKSSLLDNPRARLGRKFSSLNDLPSDKIILSFLKQAKTLNDRGVKVQQRKKLNKPKRLVVPSYLLKALKTNPKAQKTFQAFSYSNKKEYIEWLTDAKTAETRTRRLDQAIAWIAQGKSRNWKYQRS